MSRTTAPREGNRIAGLIAASNDAFEVPVILWADPDTHRLLVDSNEVQYTEGDIDASITGTALMWEGADNTLQTVSSSTPLPVTFTGGGDASAANQLTIIGHVDGIEGLLVTIDADTGAIATSVASIDTKTPALGQALAAASVPVVLTAAQLTTLTPPAAITGFATSANQTTIIGHIDGIEGLLTTIDADTSGIITAVQLIDDVVYIDDTATHSTGSSKGILFMAAATPTDTAVNANDIGALAMSLNRALHVLPQANAGVTIGAVEIAAAQTLATVTTVSTLTTLTGSSVAHDSADSGNPHKMGGKAVDVGTTQTDVTANDRTNWNFTRQGVPFVIGGFPNIINKHIQVTDADGAQTDTALITVSAGSAIIVTRYSITLDAATTATGGVAARIGFGTANTPSADANAGVLAAHSGIPAGGGIAEGDGSGIIGMGASNEDLRLTCEDPAGGNLDIVISYAIVAIG